MKNKRNPVFVFILLTIGVMLLSFVLSLFDFQAEYSTINQYTNTIQNNVVQVENMFSLEGIKYVLTSTVNNFVNFAPLGNLIIILIGIGVLEKTGLARIFFTLITQSFRKNSITYILILLSIISSLFGDIGFVLLLPISAMLFKYGHRNPLGGVIASFSGICFGYGINLFLTSIESSLLTLTVSSANVIDSGYEIGIFFQLFIMIIALIIGSILLTRVTEKTVMPSLGKYEFDEVETLDNVNFSKRELRGFVCSMGASLIYIIIIIYMIIPGLPLSGGLLDSSQVHYIDKLFGSNSLFNQGFVFIITFLFIIAGFTYASVAKTIKGDKEISECLSYSLDGIGNVLVLIFVASLFINIYDKSNIGLVLVALLTNLVNVFKFSGIGLILLLFVICILCGLIYTGLLSKWKIMSSTVVPTLMNASISPEFAQIIYVVGSSISMAFTPLTSYFVIYLALLIKYDKSNKITLFGTFKYLNNYLVVMVVMWIILLLGFYITGIPIGIGSSPVLTY